MGSAARREARDWMVNMAVMASHRGERTERSREGRERAGMERTGGLRRAMFKRSLLTPCHHAVMDACVIG